MTDLLTIYDVLTLPSGAQLVSDHGAVALLLVTRESPDKVLIERVPLGQAVSLLDAIQAAQQRGVELFTPSVSVIAQKPAAAAPKALADSQPKPEGGSWNAGKAMRKEPCKHCGTPIAFTQLVRHERICAPRAQASAPAAPEPVQPEPEPEPATVPTGAACAGCGVLFGPDHVERQPYEIVNGVPRCETCATGSVYGRRRAA